MIRSINELNTANKTGNGVQLVGTSFEPVPWLRCDDGPIQVVHQVHSNVFVSPIPLKYTCKGLYCKDFECLTRKKTNVCQWVVYYTIRQRRGRFFVSAAQIRRVCYETHLQCGCKACEDFKRSDCDSITPCPNLQNSTSNQTKCYWASHRIPQLDIGAPVSLKRNILCHSKEYVVAVT